MNTAIPLEQSLFNLLSSGEADAAYNLLDSLRPRILRMRATSEGEPQGKEYCLPLPVSLGGFQRWVTRRRQMAPDPLSRFLPHVVGNVPFYVRWFRRAKIKDGFALDQFPLVSRSEILTDYPQFLSLAFAQDSRKYFKPTSGTTGKPLVVWFDLESLYDISYATYGTLGDVIPGLVAAIEPGSLCAIQLTNSPNAWNSSTILPSLKFARLSRWVIAGDAEKDFSLIERFHTASPALLSGMPSNLRIFADVDQLLRPGDNQGSLVAIFVSGENLFEDTRRQLERWFRVPLYNAYVSTEGGLIALECRYHAGLHVQTWRAKLEILGENGNLADEGTGELVLTNFMNWAMPFVRYRTGDQATVRRNSCACGFVGSTILKMFGREAVYFTDSGRRVEPQILDPELLQLNLENFMVTQKGDRHFEVKWTSRDEHVHDDVERAIRHIIYNRFGKVRLKVLHVKQLFGPGQKFRRYVRQNTK